MDPFPSPSHVAAVLRHILCAARSYEDEEEAHRKQIFLTNLKKIEMHNYLHSKGLKSFSLGITPFTDMVSVIKTLLLSSEHAEMHDAVGIVLMWMNCVLASDMCYACWLIDKYCCITCVHFHDVLRLVYP